MWTLAVSRSPFPCSQLSGLQLETKQNIKKSADSTNIWQKAQSFQTSISKMVDQNFVKHTIFWKKATRSTEMYLDEVPKLTWILGDVRPLVKENHFCTLKINWRTRINKFLHSSHLFKPKWLGIFNFAPENCQSKVSVHRVLPFLPLEAVKFIFVRKITQ